MDLLPGKSSVLTSRVQRSLGGGMAGDSLGHWHIVFGHEKMKLHEPMPTIQAGAGKRTSSKFNHGTCVLDPARCVLDPAKPSYRVPSMDEINALPWNGFKVVSTFSGCGGSCLGYRMAGFKVVWANEFVPAAQDSYRANMTADCILDPRDIRTVMADEILAATKMEKGELDLFDGSPPCQAFSTAGKREKGWGREKTYEHGAKQCNETLFDEYLRLLRGLMPKTFIAENVSGLVKGTAKGMFLEILAAMKDCGYRVACRLLDAKWLGVPQSRQRVIFIGVRDDLGFDPAFPKPLPYFYSVRDALPEIDSVCQVGVFNEPDRVASNGPCPSVTTQGIGAKRSNSVFLEYRRGNVSKDSNWKPHNKTFDISAEPCGAIISNDGRKDYWKVGLSKRKFTIAELKRICAFPDDFILTGSYAQQWERLGNSVPPVMMRHIAEVVRDGILAQA
jgi:DNA (cytosine-5)-methyltransferase 1